MKQIFNTIIKENPIFILMLGLCPALAVTTNFENSYIMGMCFLIVIVISNIIINLIKKICSRKCKDTSLYFNYWHSCNCFRNLIK